MNKDIKRIGCTLLSVAMMQAMVPMNVLANSDVNPTEKTETVYTVLNNDGTVKDITVSSWLHDDDGIRNISESLDLKNVENVKNDEKPKVRGNVYTWNSDGNDVYYQGTTDKKLPIAIHISYELDGIERSAKEVANQSGHLKMKFHFENLASKTIQVGGRSVTIHPSFIGGGMLDLDTEHYSNVRCETGKIVNDGTNEVLIFSTVPGLSTTLDQIGLSKVASELNICDDTVIEADVQNFDLGSVMIAMTNELSLEDITNEISTGELTSGVARLMDASEQLVDGSKKLHNGTVELKENAKPLTSAYPQVEQLAQATTTLHEGTSSLLRGLTSYTNGVSHLRDGAKQLEHIPEGVQSLYGGSLTLRKGAERIEAGVNQIKSKTDALDESKLSSLEKMLVESKAQLNAMSNMVQKDKAILKKMQTSLASVEEIVKKLDAQKGQFEDVIKQYNQQVEKNNEIIRQDNQEIQDFNTKIDAANEQITQSTVNANTQIDAAIAQLNKVMETADESTKTVLKEQINQLMASKIKVDAITQKASNLKELENVDSTIFLTALQSLSKELEGLFETVKQSQSALDILDQDVNEALMGLEKMESSLNMIDGMLPGDAISLITGLKEGVNQLSAGTNSLVTGCMALQQGLNQLSAKSEVAVGQLNAGSDALTKNNEALLNGAVQLDEGASLLESQKQNFNQMSEGLKKLEVAFDTLEDGANKLYEGQSQFNKEGMGQLKTKLDLTTGEFDILQTVFDQITDLNREYDNFSGAPENAQCKVRFVFKTNEINE